MLWSSRESGRRFLVTVEISTNLTVIGKPPGFVRIRKLIKEWWIANARLSIFTEWASRESGRRFSIPVKISTNSAVIGKLPAFVRKSKLETAEFTDATIGSVNRTFCCHGLAKGYWWGGGGGRVKFAIEISSNSTVKGKPPGIVRKRKCIRGFLIVNARISSNTTICCYDLVEGLDGCSKFSVEISTNVAVFKTTTLFKSSRQHLKPAVGSDPASWGGFQK